MLPHRRKSELNQDAYRCDCLILILFNDIYSDGYISLLVVLIPSKQTAASCYRRGDENPWSSISSTVAGSGNIG